MSEFLHGQFVRTDDHVRIRATEEVRAVYAWFRLKELLAGGLDIAEAWRTVNDEIARGAALQAQAVQITRGAA